MVMGRNLAIYRSDRDPVPILIVDSKACPGMGWRMCVDLVIGCAQPDGWKVTSVEPNVEWFFELRWFQRKSHKVNMTSTFGS